MGVKRSSNISYTGLVDKYIGSSYDIVKQVYDHLDKLVLIADNIDLQRGAAGKDSAYSTFAFVNSEFKPELPIDGSFDGTTEVAPTGWTKAPSILIEPTEITWVTLRKYTHDGLNWTGSDWSDPVMYIIQGKDGAVGDAGPKGDVGDAGIGLDGTDGVDGTDGADGEHGSYRSFIFYAADLPPEPPTDGDYDGNNEIVPLGWFDTPDIAKFDESVYVSTTVWWHDAETDSWSRDEWTEPTTFIYPKPHDGSDGAVGPKPIYGEDYFTKDGAFQTFIYRNAETKPDKPTGGQFDGITEHVPIGWTDNVEPFDYPEEPENGWPEGGKPEKLYAWVSQNRYIHDPITNMWSQANEWSTPVIFTATPDSQTGLPPEYPIDTSDIIDISELEAYIDDLYEKMNWNIVQLQENNTDDVYKSAVIKKNEEAIVTEELARATQGTELQASIDNVGTATNLRIDAVEASIDGSLTSTMLMRAEVVNAENTTAQSQLILQANSDAISNQESALALLDTRVITDTGANAVANLQLVSQESDIGVLKSQFFLSGSVDDGTGNVRVAGVKGTVTAEEAILDFIGGKIRFIGVKENGTEYVGFRWNSSKFTHEFAGAIILPDGTPVESADDLGGRGLDGKMRYLEYQYSADAVNWHDELQSDDYYRRERTVTVTPGLPEDGDTIEYTDWSSFVLIRVDGNNGDDAYTVTFSNLNHTFPTDEAGNVIDFSGSGTTITVYKGNTLLQPVQTTQLTDLNAGEFDVRHEYLLTGVTESISGKVNIYSDATSSFSGDTHQTKYIVHVGTGDGLYQSFEYFQSFSKAKKGFDGTYNSSIYTLSADVPATPIGGSYTGTDETMPTGDSTWSPAPVYSSSLKTYISSTRYSQNSSGDWANNGWSVPVQFLGQDGKSIQIQYSINGVSDWHNIFNPAEDKYMRQRQEGGSWGAAAKIVGEDGTNGDYTNYMFQYSATKPPVSNNSANPGVNWKDAPTGDTTLLLWMIQAKFNGDTDNLIGTWSEPVKLTATPLKAQYSVNGVDGWHNDFNADDIFMRQSFDDGVTWTDPIRIVGEQGTGADYRDYRFDASENTPPINVSANNPGTNWVDAPPPRNANEVLWQTYADFDAEGIRLSNWIAPIQIEGKDGKKGDDGRDALLFEEHTDTAIPTFKTISTGHNKTFTTDYVGPCVVAIEGTDFEGGCYFGFNNVEIGAMSGGDNERRWYYFDVQTISGTNTIHLWSVNSDGGTYHNVLATIGAKGEPGKDGEPGPAGPEGLLPAPDGLTPGLYFDATHLGYHDGTGDVNAWKSYLDNQGNFYLEGHNDKYLRYTSSTGDLKIKGGDLYGGTITLENGFFRTADDTSDQQRVVINGNGTPIWVGKGSMSSNPGIFAVNPDGGTIASSLSITDGNDSFIFSPKNNSFKYIANGVSLISGGKLQASGFSNNSIPKIKLSNDVWAEVHAIASQYGGGGGGDGGGTTTTGGDYSASSSQNLSVGESINIEAYEHANNVEVTITGDAAYLEFRTTPVTSGQISFAVEYKLDNGNWTTVPGFNTTETFNITPDNEFTGTAFYVGDVKIDQTKTLSGVPAGSIQFRVRVTSLVNVTFSSLMISTSEVLIIGSGGGSGGGGGGNGEGVSTADDNTWIGSQTFTQPIEAEGNIDLPTNSAIRRNDNTGYNLKLHSSNINGIGYNGGFVLQTPSGITTLGMYNSTFSHFSCTASKGFYFHDAVHLNKELKLQPDDGTAITSNGVFDKGNRVVTAAQGKAYDAAQLDGRPLQHSNPDNYSVVQRDNQGDIRTRLFRSEFGSNSDNLIGYADAGIAFRRMGGASNDNFIRFANADSMRTWMEVPRLNSTTSNNNDYLYLTRTSTGTSAPLIINQTNTGYIQTWRKNGNTRAYVGNGGEIKASSFDLTSALSKKYIHKTHHDALEKMVKLGTYGYIDYSLIREDGSLDAIRTGIGADYAVGTFPNAVTYDLDGEIQGFNYNALAGATPTAFKQVNDELVAAKERISELEKTLAIVLQRLDTLEGK